MVNRFDVLSLLVWWGFRSVFFGLIASLPVSACDEIVRDAAMRAPRDVHRLCIFATTEDPVGNALAEDLNDWLEGPAHDLNLKLVLVDTDDPSVDWDEYGIPSAPPVVPVVALIGKNNATGDSFVINHWEPGPSDEQRDGLLTSPVREQIRQQVVDHLAVVLFSPSLDSDGIARATVDEAVENWSGSERLGFSIIELDRTDPQEELLVSFAGIRPDDPDWVGVVFGRGKLMSPPLRGSAITQATMADLFEQAALDCSCSKPIHTLGVDLPLVWGDEEDSSIVYLRDPTEDVDDSTLASVLPSFAADTVDLLPSQDVKAEELRPAPLQTSGSSSEAHDALTPINMTLLAMTLALGVFALITFFVLRKS
ncbi:MAG: hypothetical protein R3C02_12510 [Planctomycetaceae bacterium]